jgi:hypothetical protein
MRFTIKLTLVPLLALQACNLGEVSLGADRDGGNAEELDAGTTPIERDATSPPGDGVRDASRPDTMPSAVEMVATAGTAPLRAAIDSTSIYWTEQGMGGPAPTGRLMKAPLTGGPATALATNLRLPIGVTLDRAQAIVHEEGRYDSTLSPDAVIAQGRITAVPVTGGAATVLVDNVPHVNSGGGGHAGTVFATGGGVFYGVDERVPGGGGLFRVASTGGVPVRVANHAARSYTICQHNAEIFYGIGSIALAVPIAGGTERFVAEPSSRLISQTGCAGSSGLATVRAPGDAANSGFIAALSYDGSTARDLAPLENVFVNLAADATHVYYRDGGTSRTAGLYRVPLTGGSAEFLAPGTISFIVLDATHVYWGSWGTTPAILRKRK